jgi:hypothetical protein
MKEKIIKSQNREEKLDSLLISLIAKHDHINASEVTMDYIIEQREKKFYPVKRYEYGSRFGGYDDIGLYIFTGKELERIDKLAESFLQGI